MFWIVALFAVGGMYKAFEWLAPAVLIAVVGFAVMLPIATVFVWFNDSTGINDFLVASWQTLSGVESAGQVAGQCPPGLQHDWRILIGLLLTLVHIVAMAGSVFILPIGLVLVVFSGIYTMAVYFATEGVDADFLRTWGLGTLGVGLTCVVVSGLNMRLMHYITTDWACVPIT